MEANRWLDSLWLIALGGGNFLKRIRIEHAHPAAIESYTLLLFPDAQLLVRAFTRHADDLADLALRDRYLTILRGFRTGRQRQKRFREPARQVEKHQVFHLLAGVAQPGTKYLD